MLTCRLAVCLLLLCRSFLTVTAVPIAQAAAAIDESENSGTNVAGDTRGWKLVSPTEAVDGFSQGKETKLFVVFALKQQNLPELSNLVDRVSDPTSVDYTHFLTLSKVQELVAPSLEARRSVQMWLGDAAEQLQVSFSGDFISCWMSIRELERHTQTVYHLFRHPEMQSMIVRSLDTPRFPDDISQLLDFISPSNDFPPLERMDARKSPPPRVQVTPELLRKLYKVPETAVGGRSKMSQAVASFIGEYFSQTDLDSFQAEYSPSSGSWRPHVVGANKDSSPTTEASLDIQYLMGVAPSMPTEFWYTSGKQPHNMGAEPFLSWLLQVSNTSDAKIPKVFSISYADDENKVRKQYAMRVSVELQKAAARGISILVATGDGGVGGNQNEICFGKHLIPTFPASSPYITAVGGTWNQDPETGAQYSSGGFSNYFPRPAYQNRSVAEYIHKSRGSLPEAKKWNHTGRAFPDVSAQSAAFAIKVAGKDDEAYGTSASTPAVSAIVALLNDFRAAAGKAPLGLLNPLIYQHPEVFNDVTSGNNPACGTQGFKARKGWDPVTGVGTPNFEKLLELVLSLGN